MLSQSLHIALVDFGAEVEHADSVACTNSEAMATKLCIAWHEPSAGRHGSRKRVQTQTCCRARCLHGSGPMNGLALRPPCGQPRDEERCTRPRSMRERTFVARSVHPLLGRRASCHLTLKCFQELTTRCGFRHCPRYLRRPKVPHSVLRPLRGPLVCIRPECTC